MYYHYALQKHPDTVELRQIRWMNGPSPGKVFKPPTAEHKIYPDWNVYNWYWFGDANENFQKQMYADKAMGYDFIAYHSYAKRRFHNLLRGGFI